MCTPTSKPLHDYLDYYESQCPIYDIYRSDILDCLQDRLHHILRIGSIDSSSHILDIGCGTGRYSLTLSDLTGCKIVGLDIHKSMLSQAKKKDKKASILWCGGDGTVLPFCNEVFDLILIIYVIHQVNHPFLLFKEAYRTLKFGGRLIICTSSYQQLSSFILYRACPQLLWRELSRFPSIQDINRIALENGFEKENEIVEDFPRNFIPKKFFFEMIKNRFLSILSSLSKQEIEMIIGKVDKLLGKDGTEQIRTYGYTILCYRKVNFRT